jgi:hypothetical protein
MIPINFSYTSVLFSPLVYVYIKAIDFRQDKNEIKSIYNKYMVEYHRTRYYRWDEKC